MIEKCSGENVSITGRKKLSGEVIRQAIKNQPQKVLASRADLFNRVPSMSGFYIHSVFLMWLTSPVHVF